MATEAKTSEPGITWRGPLPVQALFAVMTFLAGSLFTAGMGWGGSNKSLENIQASISRVEGEIKLLSDRYDALSEKYRNTDTSTRTELQKIEDHLSYDDNRLDKLEASRK